MENPAPKDAILKGRWQVSKVPPGSTKTVACVKRSEKMDRFYKFGTLNSGGPGSKSLVAVRLPRAIGDQPQEDAIWTSRESDPPIVVRDGNAGHRAKGWAWKQRKHSTHTGPRRSHQLCQASCLQWKPILALCVGVGFMCALPEEPGAVVPHAGICEGGVG